MYRLVGQISPEQLGVIARQLYIEMLKGGFTSVAEFHYVHQDTHGQPYANPAELALQVSHAAASVGIGMTLLPVLYTHSGFGGLAPNEGQRRFINSTDRYLDLQSRLKPFIDAQPAQALGLCFHSLRAVTPQQISDVLAASNTQCPVHIHIAEQQRKSTTAWPGVGVVRCNGYTTMWRSMSAGAWCTRPMPKPMKLLRWPKAAQWPACA